METQTDNQRPSNGQLILPHKETIRLLEVYVKRSLSLNDGTLGGSKGQRKQKWVTIPVRQRRHSSDPSIHLGMGLNDEEISHFSQVEPPADQPQTLNEESEKFTRKSKKIKKPSFWKSFLGIFSRKSSDDKSEEKDGPPEISSLQDNMTTFRPTSPVNVKNKKSTRRKTLKRRLSKRGLIKPNKTKELNHSDITRVEDVVSVEPTYSYYEKVSEELEKIVHEVKENEEVQPLSDEEVINRIIALTKEQGDAIDDKLKDNPTLSNFFQQMSYLSFQKLADTYLETEASPIHNPPTVLPTAPELVRLAFTYDFTAKVARLSRQNLGHITGLGNRYLQDRFEYQQASSDHPVSDSDS